MGRNPGEERQEEIPSVLSRRDLVLQRSQHFLLPATVSLVPLSGLTSKKEKCKMCVYMFYP